MKAEMYRLIRAELEQRGLVIGGYDMLNNRVPRKLTRTEGSQFPGKSNVIETYSASP